MLPISYYSHNQGYELMRENHADGLREILECITAVDAENHRTKESEERSRQGKMLFSPVGLNKGFAREFGGFGWVKVKIPVETRVIVNECLDEATRKYYISMHSDGLRYRGSRAISFVKSRIGLEVQLGKYAFTLYDIMTKMTAFHNQRIIDVGVEIVPMRSFSKQMSSGVASFERLKADLELRGAGHGDVSVLVIGIDQTM